MTILRTKPTVDFDPHNPSHVKAISDLDTMGKLNSELRFDFPSPFLDGVSYARHLMAKAWMEKMKGTDETSKKVALPNANGNPNRVVIGLKARPTKYY